MSPEHFFSNLLPQTLNQVFDLLPDQVVFAFFLDEEAWQLNRLGPDVRVGPVTEVPKDCEFHCSEEVFVQIISGSLNPSRAFLDGRLRLQGDLGLALHLQRVLVA
jgi:putative sterol carrier protein